MLLTALCVVTMALVAALVTAEQLGATTARYVLKPLASVGFLVTAWHVGALTDGGTYGAWIFAGLVLSFFGDVFLMPDDRPNVFLAGLGSFLLGHVAYAVAFVTFGMDWAVAGASALVLVPIAVAVWRWLSPHVPGDMRIPVIAYVVVITTMVAHSLGAWRAGGSLLMPIGATMFWISDLAVARRQFIDPSPRSAIWGLPLYYGAQLVLAISVAAVQTPEGP